MFSPEFTKFLISYQNETTNEIKEIQEEQKAKEQRTYSVPVFSKRAPIVIPLRIDE